MSTGLLQAHGFRIVAACEWDPAAAATYGLNHPGTVVIPMDITQEETRREVCAAFDGVRCDVIVGGIPCQAYTKSKFRDPNDPRASLYEPFITVVTQLMPPVVVIENVPDIMTAEHPDGTLVQQNIAALLRGLGYAVGFRILNAADFGVAQRRRRAFIFAWRRGTCPLPQPTRDEHGRNGWPKWLTIRDAIADLEDAPEDDAWSHTFTRHKPRYLDRIRRTPIGGKASIGYNEGAYRDAPDRPSRTLRGGGWIIHYRHDRVITPREAARLQGFPDEFRFTGTRSEVALQIGNAVPPPLAKAVGLAVMGMLGCRA
jgi:DNA (cytosine-5)-methyltransferase 1